MPRLSLRFLAPALAVLLSVFSVAVFAAAPPTLFTVNAGAPTVLAQGAQKSWPIKVSETSAFDAVFQGGGDAAARDRLVSILDPDLMQPDWALGYRFDIVLRGRAATPFENA